MHARHSIYPGLIALALAFICLPALGEATAARLGSDVRPTSQAIHLTLDPRQSEYRGSVEIHLTVDQATDHFRLHSKGHKFERFTLSGAAG